MFVLIMICPHPKKKHLIFVPWFYRPTANIVPNEVKRKHIAMWALAFSNGEGMKTTNHQTCTINLITPAIFRPPSWPSCSHIRYAGQNCTTGTTNDDGPREKKGWQKCIIHLLLEYESIKVNRTTRFIDLNAFFLLTLFWLFFFAYSFHSYRHFINLLCAMNKCSILEFGSNIK